MSWCIVIEGGWQHEPDTVTTHDCAPQRTVSSQNPFHSSDSFAVHIFLAKATCLSSSTQEHLCSKTLSAHLGHSAPSSQSRFPPQHDVPPFLHPLNPAAVSITFWQRCSLRRRHDTATVDQLCHKPAVKSRGFTDAPNQRMTLLFTLRCYYQAHQTQAS